MLIINGSHKHRCVKFIIISRPDNYFFFLCRIQEQRTKQEKEKTKQEEVKRDTTKAVELTKQEQAKRDIGVAKEKTRVYRTMQRIGGNRSDHKAKATRSPTI